MADLLIVAVVAVIIGLVSRYICKEKKSGAVCIGCPSGGCNGCCSGCSGCSDQH